MITKLVIPIVSLTSSRNCKMGVEIERKFLVDKEKWSSIKPVSGYHILQGYLSKEIARTVRIRIKGKKGYLTIKGKTVGATRAEYEYEIPVNEAKEMITSMCNTYIDKTRFEIVFDGKTWEVDEFLSPQKGLVLAEIELEQEGEEIHLPDWITEEVTDDPSYYNANMV